MTVASNNTFKFQEQIIRWISLIKMYIRNRARPVMSVHGRGGEGEEERKGNMLKEDQELLTSCLTRTVHHVNEWCDLHQMKLAQTSLKKVISIMVIQSQI